MDYYELDRVLKSGDTVTTIEYLTSLDIEQEDRYGDRVLHRAAYLACPHAIAWLVEQGVDCWAVNHYNHSAFHRLTQSQSSDVEAIKQCFKFLYQAGCPTEQRDESGECFYHKAAQLANLAIFEAMKECQFYPQGILSSTGETTLHILCHYTNQYDYLVGTPRYDEESEPRYQSVKIMLELGADPEEKTNIGRTALDFALENKAYRFAVLLKGQQDNPLQVLAKGMTLHQAAMENDVEAIEALVELNQDINQPSEEKEVEGLTPLMCACRRINPEATEKLIQLGAQVEYRSGTTHKTAMGELFQARWHQTKIKGQITPNRVSTLLRLLIKQPDSINQRVDEKDNTALHLVCENIELSWWADSKTVMEVAFPILVTAKPDLSLRNQAGRTLLHQLCLAAGQRAEMPIERLLQMGADINAQDSEGNTPLHLACKQKNLGDAQLLVTCLCRHPLNPTIKNEEGKTPSELAAEQNYEKIMLKLLEKESEYECNSN